MSPSDQTSARIDVLRAHLLGRQRVERREPMSAPVVVIPASPGAT